MSFRSLALLLCLPAAASARAAETVGAVKPPAVAARRIAKAGAAVKRDRSVSVTVGSAFDKTGRAGVLGTARLRETLLAQVGRAPGFTVEYRTTGYVLEASIVALDRKLGTPWVEVSCEISFIVARLPGRSIVGMTSVGAMVQSPRLTYESSQDEPLNIQAIESAVQGARGSLIELITRAQKQVGARPQSPGPGDAVEPPAAGR
ncbi:MAG: hypothetical protein EXR72_25480 [Myxococcales bacterium]|nr:hypothetical protein [Myxococcales bacterium]